MNSNEIPKNKLVPLKRDWDLMSREDSAGYGFGGSVPWSDDLLDSGVQYLKISRELMGLDDEII